MQLTNHPAANSFPIMGKKRLNELIRDMQEQGQLEPITLCEGMILDGRNRYQACIEIGIEPITRTFEGDPWARAWSLNGERRDLIDEQRYLIWKHCHEKSEAWQTEKQNIADAANRKRSVAAITGKTQCLTTPSDRNVGQTAKAAAAKVNTGAVARGDKLAKERPDLADKVMRGEMRPADAHRELKREEHKAKLSQPAPVATTGKHSIILADPPWKYDHQQAENRAIENQYPTSDLETIKSHSPETEENAILFLWATAPKLKEALEVMEAWGFRYVTNAVWNKKKIGMGYWFRGSHELLLVGVKGNPGTVPECARRSSVFEEAREQHSKKPVCVYEWIEHAFPDKTKLEMYCRSPRKGWMGWGNEI